MDKVTSILQIVFAIGMLAAPTVHSGETNAAYQRSSRSATSASDTTSREELRRRYDFDNAPIKSRHDLDAYLKRTRIDQSPLACLTAGGRHRFVDGLRFGPKGLGGFSTIDLRDQCTHAQTRAILALFGAQSYTDSIDNVPTVPRAIAAASRRSGNRARFSAIERAYDGLFRFVQDRKLDSLPDRTRAKAIEHRYQLLFTGFLRPGTDRSLRDGDLKILFRAASTVAFYTYDPKYVAEMRRRLNLLEQRGMATNAEYADMFQTYVAQRDFAVARKLRAAHPGMHVEALPRIEDRTGPYDGAPGVLDVWAHTSTLVHRNVSLNPDAQVIVVGSPLCHFTQHAMQDIEADTRLRDALSRPVLWLAPQTGELDLRQFRQWNRTHPEARMVIAYRQNEWPQISTWQTPTFYFFKSGKLVRRVVGWPPQGNGDAVMSALREIGLSH